METTPYSIILGRNCEGEGGMATWTREIPTKPGWYWTRWKIKGNPCLYSYNVMHLEERWPGPELVDADDPFSFSLRHDSYAKHEWAGPLEPPQ
jgi:hypothetical protein